MRKVSRAAAATTPDSLAEVQIQLLGAAKTKAHAHRLLAKHHYLGDVRAVGEQFFYAITDARIGIYPLWSLAAIAVLAHLCGAPRGQKDLARFAQGLSQAQRGALGVRRQRDGKYPAPSQPTFCRMMKHLDDAALEKVFLPAQRQIRGPAPPHELIVLSAACASPSRCA